MLAKVSAELRKDIGLLLIRGIVGAVFVYHGGQKLFGWWDGPGLAGFAAYLQQLQLPFPAYAAVLAGAAEFFGAVCIISGVGIRIAAVPMMITMASAIYFVHPTAFGLQAQGMEYPLTLGVILAGLLFTGPGRFGLHAIPVGPWLARRRAVHTLSEMTYVN
jgi:putative oxidoreductase